MKQLAALVVALGISATGCSGEGDPTAVETVVVTQTATPTPTPTTGETTEAAGVSLADACRDIRLRIAEIDPRGSTWVAIAAAAQAAHDQGDPATQAAFGPLIEAFQAAADGGSAKDALNVLNIVCT